LTLPRRFMMMKTPTSTKRMFPTDIDNPDDFPLDSTSSHIIDPNHKRRDIFG